MRALLFETLRLHFRLKWERWKGLANNSSESLIILWITAIMLPLDKILELGATSKLLTFWSMEHSKLAETPLDSNKNYL